MPWMETSVAEQRWSFVQDFVSGQWSMTELCERYRITRPTGYKWVARVKQVGRAGIAELSRAPHHSPRRTPEAIARRIIAARRQYGWGAKKLRALLRQRAPTQPWPARSTINAILDRHGQ